MACSLHDSCLSRRGCEGTACEGVCAWQYAAPGTEHHQDDSQQALEPGGGGGTARRRAKVSLRQVFAMSVTWTKYPQY